MAKESTDETTPLEGAMKFEQILEKLEGIVEKLESGDEDLEGSLDLFEEGVKLSRQGHAILDRAETRVQTLLESGEEKDGIDPAD